MSITRRLFLRNSAGAAAATVAVPAIAAGPTPPSSIDRVRAAVAELRHAMDAHVADQAGSWNVYMLGNRADGKRDIVIVTQDGGRTPILDPEDAATDVRICIDDSSPLLADDVTGTTAYADWEAGRARS